MEEQDGQIRCRITPKAHNVRDETLLVHTIDANALFLLFRRINMPLTLRFKGELGFPNFANVDQAISPRNLNDSIAYLALQAARVVIYSKGSKIAYHAFAREPNPAITHMQLPAYIGALIKAMGPIRLGGIPSRRKRVPLLPQVDVLGNRPAQFDQGLVGRFYEVIGRTKLFSSPSMIEVKHPTLGGPSKVQMQTEKPITAPQIRSSSTR